MGQSRLHYIPLTLFFYFPITFTICFIVAYQMDHINLAFAFISDTGTLPPEQYLFAQFMNMGAALYAYFVYIRYIQVEQYMKIRYSQSTPIGNTIALAFGFTSSLGMSIVGNFPELHMKQIHIIGAFLAFVGGSIYIVHQGYYTFKLMPHFESKEIAYFRTFLGIFALMMYFGAQITVILAFQRIHKKETPKNQPLTVKWTKEDGGYEFQAVSVVMEWLLLVVFDIFILTFVPEFRKLKLDSPPMTFLVNMHLSERQRNSVALSDDLSDDQSSNNNDQEGTLASDRDPQLPIPQVHKSYKLSDILPATLQF